MCEHRDTKALHSQEGLVDSDREYSADRFLLVRKSQTAAEGNALSLLSKFDPQHIALHLTL